MQHEEACAGRVLAGYAAREIQGAAAGSIDDARGPAGARAVGHVDHAVRRISTADVGHCAGQVDRAVGRGRRCAQGARAAAHVLDRGELDRAVVDEDLSGETIVGIAQDERAAAVLGEAAACAADHAFEIARTRTV